MVTHLQGCGRYSKFVSTTDHSWDPRAMLLDPLGSIGSCIYTVWSSEHLTEVLIDEIRRVITEVCSGTSNLINALPTGTSYCLHRHTKVLYSQTPHTPTRHAHTDTESIQVYTTHLLYSTHFIQVSSCLVSHRFVLQTLTPWRHSYHKSTSRALKINLKVLIKQRGYYNKECMLVVRWSGRSLEPRGAIFTSVAECFKYIIYMYI